MYPQLNRNSSCRDSSPIAQRLQHLTVGRMLKLMYHLPTQRQNECACSADLWFERESISNAPLQSPNSHLLPQYFFC